MPTNILITGTTTGLGRCMVEVLAERGHTVIATMRDPDGKDRLAARTLTEVNGRPGRVVVVPMDVASDESVARGVALALKQVEALDVVVNNAGYAISGVGESVTSGQLLDLLNTNLVGPHRVTRAVLPHMRARRSGLVVFISSGAGRLTVPGMGAYSASKFGLEALAQAYRYELRGLGIDVSIVQPGAFPSNLAASQRVGADGARVPDYGPVLELTQQFMQGVGKAFTSREPPDPREVADAVAALVEAAPGSRPERVSVDRFELGRAVEAINASTHQATTALLQSLGLGIVTG